MRNVIQSETRGRVLCGWVKARWMGLLALAGLLAFGPAALAATTLTTLHEFSGGPTDGAVPQAPLVQGSDGNLYGTTTQGGVGMLDQTNPNNGGTVFEIGPDGTQFQTLHTFLQSQGYSPTAGLVLGSDSNFYGTTSGLDACCVIFKITPITPFTETTVYTFGSVANDGNRDPTLLLASDGNFYGTTSGGGANNGGTVFRLTPGSQSTTTLHPFTFQDPSGDGYTPIARLLEGSDGDLYGTTTSGGNNTCGSNGLQPCGTVFKIKKDGSGFQTMHKFSGGTTDGSDPQNGLTEDDAGTFYGTTTYGGVNGQGTIFKITSSGTSTPTFTFASLHSFNFTDGGNPLADLTLASDGNFYGTTRTGGTHGAGTVFQFTPSSVAVTTMYSFGTQAGDGAAPYAGVVQAIDGNFYGTTSSGGTGPSGGNGVVFKLATGLTVAPAGLTAVAGDAQVTLNWTTLKGAGSYNVYQGTTPNSESTTPVQTGITGNTQIITGLTDGQTYYFKIRAVAGSMISGLSNEASATPLALPAQVTNLAATPGNAQVILNWSAASGATGYIVYQGTSSGAETQVANTNGTTFTYTATPLTNGTTYYFKVAGTNAAGTGPVSNEASATPLAGIAATPVFAPAGGSFSAAQSVTISDTTTGAAIYYTADGTTPTANSTKYTAAIAVSTTETLKAIAIATGYTNSAVATATYTINIPQAATPTFSPAGGAYGAAQSVTISETTTGAAIYYTADGTTPTANSTKYTAAIPVSSTETLKAIAVATGYTNSAVATATYTINLPQAATPTFSPSGGSFSSAQTVTISDTTTGATIYYTTDGSTPSASSTPYTGPITVSASETVNAIATATGDTNSGVATASYAIDGLPVQLVTTNVKSGGGAISWQLTLALSLLAMLRVRALFAGLVVRRFTGICGVLLVLVVAGAGSTRADESAAPADAGGFTDHLYIGLRAGSMRLNLDSGKLDRDLTALGYGNVHVSTHTGATAGTLYLGYELARNTDLEFGYTHRDAHVATLSGTAPSVASITPLLQDTTGLIRGYGDIFAVSLRGRLEPVPRLTIDPRLGVFVWDTKVMANTGPASFSKTHEGGGVTVGVGAAYRMWRGLEVGIGADYFRGSPKNTAALYSGSLEWRFGKAD